MIKFIILDKESAFFIVDHIALYATSAIEMPTITSEPNIEGEFHPDDYEYEFITKIGDDPVEIMICGEEIFKFFVDELEERI